MHELAIARTLFGTVIEKACENSLKKITKIRIVIGQASGIEPGYLRHSFNDHIIPGTIAETAILEFIPERITAKCSECGVDIKPDKPMPVIFNCPSCGSSGITVVSGTETYIENIEGE